MRGRILPKLLFGFVALLVILYIVKQPLQASDTTSGIAAWLSNTADTLGTFLGNLFT